MKAPLLAQRACIYPIESELIEQRCDSLFRAVVVASDGQGPTADGAWSATIRFDIRSGDGVEGLDDLRVWQMPGKQITASEAICV